MGIMTILLAAGLLAGDAPQLAGGFLLTTHTEMRFGNRPDAPGPNSALPLVLGQTQRLEIASAPDSCGFRDVHSPQSAPGTAVGWQLEATPTLITPEHAIVLVRWVRKSFGAKPSVAEPNQSVVFLRPGDQVRLDTLRLPDVTPKCASPLGTLVIGLQAREAMRTLTSTDLWLVHKAPGGKESTQHVNVRGKFNEPLSFFFEGVRAGQRVIDVFGEITLRARSATTVGLELSAQRHLIVESDQPDEVTDGFPNAIAGYFGTGVSDVAIDVGPDSVTSFEIPLGTRPEWAPFAGHSLSVRVKSKRIR